MNYLKFVFSAAPLLFITALSTAQMTFSVSPGVQLYGASFGYMVKRAVPFVGLQILNGSVNIKETGFETNYADNTVDPYTDTYKVIGAAFAPTIGLKYFFKDVEKVRTYGLISATTVILSAKVEDSEDAKENEYLQDEIKNLRIFGGQLGFGAEYFFENAFSVGGEFGVRFIYLSNEITKDQSVYNPGSNNYEDYKATYSYKYSVNPTYAKISLNYYFAGNKSE